MPRRSFIARDWLKQHGIKWVMWNKTRRLIIYRMFLGNGIRRQASSRAVKTLSDDIYSSAWWLVSLMPLWNLTQINSLHGVFALNDINEKRCSSQLDPKHDMIPVRILLPFLSKPMIQGSIFNEPLGIFIIRRLPGPYNSRLSRASYVVTQLYNQPTRVPKQWSSSIHFFCSLASGHLMVLKIQEKCQTPITAEIGPVAVISSLCALKKII